MEDFDRDEFVSVPEICGPSWWAMIHGWAEAIRDHACPSCGGEAVKMASAMHDLVNHHLGKPLHDAATFQEVAELYTEAAGLGATLASCTGGLSCVQDTTDCQPSPCAAA